MAAGRELHLHLDLLDRQLLDRRGTPCGNVDDVELVVGDDGLVTVTALLTGPGRLTYRLGGRRIGRWLERVGRSVRGTGEGEDRSRIPIELAFELGPAIRIAKDADDVAGGDVERWTRDHIIDKIPGGRRAPPDE